MAINPYFQGGLSIGVTSEQRLIESIIIQAIGIFGCEVFYIPRTSVNPDKILGEDVLNQFVRKFPIEMYLTNVEGWEGDGEQFSKFGITITDQATFVVSKRRWEEEVSLKTNNLQLIHRPAEGDLIYFPLTNALFEITYVQHLDPFFQIGKFYVYSLQCELYQYSSEVIDTGIPDLDLQAELRTTDIYLYALENATGGNLLNSKGLPIIRATYNSRQQTPMTNTPDFALEGASVIDFSEANPFGGI